MEDRWKGDAPKNRRNTFMSRTVRGPEGKSWGRVKAPKRSVLFGRGTKTSWKEVEGKKIHEESPAKKIGSEKKRTGKQKGRWLRRSNPKPMKKGDGEGFRSSGERSSDVLLGNGGGGVKKKVEKGGVLVGWWGIP